MRKFQKDSADPKADAQQYQPNISVYIIAEIYTRNQVINNNFNTNKKNFTDIKINLTKPST